MVRPGTHADGARRCSSSRGSSTARSRRARKSYVNGGLRAAIPRRCGDDRVRQLAQLVVCELSRNASAHRPAPRAAGYLPPGEERTRSGGKGGARRSCGARVSYSELAALAKGARYAASVQLRESRTRIGSVSGFGKEVAIVAPTSRRDSLARYSGPGRTTRRGVFGRLGRFGSVALSFRRKGGPPGCPARLLHRRAEGLGDMEGTFRGSIRFDPDAHLPGFARTGSFSGRSKPCRAGTATRP